MLKISHENTFYFLRYAYVYKHSETIDVKRYFQVCITVPLIKTYTEKRFCVGGIYCSFINSYGVLNLITNINTLKGGYARA